MESGLCMKNAAVGISLGSDIVLNINEQDPPEEHRFGVTKLTDWLFLGGEEDVCQVLDSIDVWIVS